MNTDLETRLVELEIKYSHQEELLEQLNKIVAKQSRIIDKTTRELNELKLSSINSQENIGSEKPPHY
jgi:SlyX protein